MITTRTLLLVGMLLMSTVVSCSFTSRPLNERLQTALDARLRRCAVKGASAAVVLTDGTVWRGAAGISHPGADMSPEMAFAIGSITKNMVAALTLQLAEEGKLSLEDPIGKWLPPYPHVNPAITIRQMLNHTSGLFMFWDNEELWNDPIRYRTKHFTPEEVLRYLQEPHFRPGEGYRYSNTAYLLAAMIITRATGSPSPSRCAGASGNRSGSGARACPRRNRIRRLRRTSVETTSKRTDPAGTSPSSHGSPTTASLTVPPACS